MNEMEKYFECRKHLLETKVKTLSYNPYTHIGISIQNIIGMNFGRQTGKSYFHAWLMNKFEIEQIPYMSIFQTGKDLKYFKSEYRKYGVVNKHHIKIIQHEYSMSHIIRKYVIIDNYDMMLKQHINSINFQSHIYLHIIL